LVVAEFCLFCIGVCFCVFCGVVCVYSYHMFVCCELRCHRLGFCAV
jgi:hypothetical protein